MLELGGRSTQYLWWVYVNLLGISWPPAPTSKQFFPSQYSAASGVYELHHEWSRWNVYRECVSQWMVTVVCLQRICFSMNGHGGMSTENVSQWMVTVICLQRMRFSINDHSDMSIENAFFNWWSLWYVYRECVSRWMVTVMSTENAVLDEWS